MAADETYDKKAENKIINFLKTNVPKSDVQNIETELKKDFVLGKIKSKGAKKKEKKKKAKHCLTRNGKKSLGFYVIPRDSVKYKDVLPMHDIWIGYISQLLELNKAIPNCTSKAWDSFTQSVYRADFHGSMLHVIRSKCPSYVGKKGLCIMDTKNTFKIVSKDDIVTTIPKKECVFEISVNNMTITMFGKLLCARPAERSTKKIKNHFYPDL